MPGTFISCIELLVPGTSDQDNGTLEYNELKLCGYSSL